MNLAVSRHVVNDAVVRIAVAGEIDLSTCDSVASAIQDVVTADRAAELIVDLDQVTFLDSTGVRVLVAGQRLARQHGSAYLVINARGIVHRVLEVSGVLDALCLPERATTQPI